MNEHDQPVEEARRLWVPLLNESFYSTFQTPEQMDALWAEAWRHFGPEFVRHSISLEQGHPQVVQPLRVVLAHFRPSRSQRRLLRRNADLEVRLQPPILDAERHQLFAAHKARFKTAVPDALTDFLGVDPGQYPCEVVEVGVYAAGRLVAASYLDVGVQGASSLYAMFCPQWARRRLGIGTMLWEMQYARERGCRYYYPGYAFHEPSALDYKKQFAGTEWYDWQGQWRPCALARRV